MIKKIRNILLIGFISGFFASCDFLQVEKIGKSDIETFFAEATSLQTAMYGTYSMYYSFYDRYYLPYLTTVSDELSLTTNAGTLFLAHDYALTSNEESTYVGYIWKNGYGVIANCNQIITHTEDLIKAYPNQEAHFRHVAAQAYFIRAITHFQLCCAYGQNYFFTEDASHLGVPIIRHIPSLTEKIKRNTVKEVYDAVIEDLHTSISMYGSDFGDGPYYASRLASKALLARVYLYKRDYANAYNYANELVGNSALALTDSTRYFNMYCNAQDSGSEAIFRLNGYSQSSELPSIYYYETPEARPSDKLKNSFAGTTDVRNHFQCRMPKSEGDENVMTEFTNVVVKYTCTDNPLTTQKEDRYCNPFILRLSEMYLICAEALCKMQRSNDAEGYLKAVIARAQGKERDDITLTWSNDDQMAALIQAERFKELCYEGHRFLDLTRNHQAIERDSNTNATVKYLAYPDYRMVLPISYVEIDANEAMVQNPQYE